jgi:hypothetical protein
MRHTPVRSQFSDALKTLDSLQAAPLAEKCMAKLLVHLRYTRIPVYNLSQLRFGVLEPVLPVESRGQQATHSRVVRKITERVAAKIRTKRCIAAAEKTERAIERFLSCCDAIDDENSRKPTEIPAGGTSCQALERNPEA